MHLMRYLQPLVANIPATYYLLNAENEHQRSINEEWCWIFGNQGIVRIFEHMTPQLTALKGQNAIYQTKNTDFKLIAVVNC